MKLRPHWSFRGILVISAALFIRVVASASEAPTQVRFELLTLDATMVNPWLKTTGDLDGDGRADIVVGAARRGGLVAFLNRFPLWERQVIDPEHRFSTDGEVADLDGDGRQDLVVLTLGPDTVTWYQRGESGWTPRILARQTWHDLEVADFDGDGRPDVVGRNQREWPAKDDAGNHLRFLWQKRQGAGIAWEESSLDCPAGEGLLAVDLDRDGDPDIITNGAWFENLGQRRWKAHAFARPEDWSHPNAFIASGDFNGDRRPDLALSPSEIKGGRYRIVWFEAPADPRQDGWRAHFVVPDVETVCHFVGAADFDGDGRVDLAYAQMPQGADPDAVRVLFNRGKQSGGEWTDTWERLTISDAGSHSMRILDADGDGAPDLFGANWNAEGRDETVKLWLNRSPGGKHAVKAMPLR